MNSLVVILVSVNNCGNFSAHSKNGTVLKLSCLCSYVCVTISLHNYKDLPEVGGTISSLSTKPFFLQLCKYCITGTQRHAGKRMVWSRD